MLAGDVGIFHLLKESKQGSLISLSKHYHAPRRLETEPRNYQVSAPAKSCRTIQVLR